MQALSVRAVCHEEHIVKAVLALFLAWAFAGLGWFCAERVLHHFNRGLGHLLACFAGAGEHHFVVLEVFTVGVTEKEIGAVDVLGVDRCHDKGRCPFVEVCFVHGHHARGLTRTFKAFCKSKRIAQRVDEGGVLGRRLHGCTKACRCSARESACHRTDTATDFGRWRTEAFFRRFLGH